MSRVSYGVARRRKRRRIMKQAKGFYSGRRKLWRTAKETLRRAWRYKYVHRRLLKREYRRLWITRISAAVRVRGLSYSRFMEGCKVAKIEINRKLLSELAIHDPKAFDTIFEEASKHVTMTGKKQPVG